MKLIILLFDFLKFIPWEYFFIICLHHKNYWWLNIFVIKKPRIKLVEKSRESSLPESSVCITYLCFWDKYVRSPSTISKNSYSTIYTTVITKMIIRIMTMVAFVASTIRIDSNTLTDFKDGHFWSEFIDSTYKLVSKSQRFFFTWKAPL